MSATKIRPGYYHYKGCEIYQDWESELFAGWWKVGPTLERANREGIPYEFNDEFPTKRAAMAAIDS